MSIKMFQIATLFVFILAFIGCGGKPTLQEMQPQNVDVISPADEFLDVCKSEYKNDYCGIGQAVSTKQQVARDIASANARNELATSVQMTIEATLKRGVINTINDEAIETTFQKISQEVSNELSNVEIQKTRTQYNKSEDKYTLYVLVTTSRDGVGQLVKNKISNTQALSDAAVSKALMDVIDAEINKGK